MSEPEWFKRTYGNSSKQHNISYGVNSYRSKYAKQNSSKADEKNEESSWSKMVKQTDAYRAQKKREQYRYYSKENLSVEKSDTNPTNTANSAQKAHSTFDNSRREVSYYGANTSTNNVGLNDSNSHLGIQNTKTLQVDETNEDAPSVKQETVKPAVKKRPYVSAFDGLRSLAIIGVLFYHMNFIWCKGGLIGVTIFFVLSGYLITGIICNEIDKTGALDLKNFWIHRVRRLFPAIAIVVFSVLVLTALFNHVLLTKARPDVVPSLVWFQNWWYIIRNLSYFDNLGDPSPLVHFWSLAIEEQFYLFWPLIILLLKKLGCKNKHLFAICLGLAAFSAAEMMIMYNPLADPTRVYYGTDTRAFSLLIGAALAIICPWQKIHESGAKSVKATIFNQLEINSAVLNVDSDDAILKERGVNNSALVAIDTLGICSTIGILLIMVFVDGTSSLMYRGFLLLTSVLTACIILALMTPETKLSKIFSASPLVWVGKRSYGIYLWHLPILLLLKPLADGIVTWWLAILVMVICFLVAGVQYKFVEEPCRRGAIGRFITKIKSSRSYIKPTLIILVASLVAIIAVVFVTYSIPDESIMSEEAIGKSGEATDQAQQVGDSNNVSNGIEIGNSTSFVQGCKYPVLIGDSVASGTDFKQYFSSLYPYTLVDSVVGRKTSEAATVLKQYIDQGVVGNVVVISCFSNHPMTGGELDSIYNEIGSNRQLFLITSFTQYPLTPTNNQMISDFCKQHQNVHAIDWYSIANSDSGTLLYKDKVHLVADIGVKAYADLIATSIDNYLPKEARMVRANYVASKYVAAPTDSTAANTIQDNTENSSDESSNDENGDLENSSEE